MHVFLYYGPTLVLGDALPHGGKSGKYDRRTRKAVRAVVVQPAIIAPCSAQALSKTHTLQHAVYARAGRAASNDYGMGFR